MAFEVVGLASLPGAVSASAAAPTWADGMSAIVSALTLLALVAGGLTGYARYWRGRILHPGCETDVAAREVVIAGGRALHVEAAVTNSGTVLLAFVKDSAITLSIDAMNEPIWEDAIEHGGDVLWSEGLFYERNLLDAEGQKRKSRKGKTKQALEPKERFRWHLLVPLDPPFGLGPFRVTVRTRTYPRSMFGYGRVQVWSSEIVVYGGEVRG